MGILLLLEFIKEKDNNIIVRELSTAKNNLKKHLERVHANTKLTERDDIASSKQKRKTEDKSMSKLKQQQLDFSGSAMIEPQEVRNLWKGMLLKICSLCQQ